jgi:hypothetical protein
VSRLRLPRPSGRRLSAAVALLGVVAGLAILLLPVAADLTGEPLLRLSPFSPSLAQGLTAVDCGSPVGNFGRSSDGLGLYQLARDDACRAAASRRAATAVAVAAVIGLLGVLGLVRPPSRRLVAA